MLAPRRLRLAVRTDVEEPQRRPGQRQPAERRVLDVDEQALRERLVPAVDLVDGADLARRDADLREPGQQVLGGDVGEGPLEQGDHLVAVARRGRRWSPSRAPRGRAELGAQPAPQRLVGARDLHAAAGAVEQAVRGDRGVVVALRAADLAGHRPSIAPYGLFHCADGSVQVACASESLWRKLCAEFGFDPEAPGWRPTASGWRTATR